MIFDIFNSMGAQQYSRLQEHAARKAEEQRQANEHAARLDCGRRFGLKGPVRKCGPWRWYGAPTREQIINNAYRVPLDSHEDTP